MTDPPNLFSTLLDPTRQAVKVRRDARDTSKVAGRFALPRSGTQRMKVLTLISRESLTDDQIIVISGLPHQSVGPRRLELEEGGWIEDSGQRRLTRSNKPAIVWQLTDAGRAAFDLPARPV